MLKAILVALSKLHPPFPRKFAAYLHSAHCIMLSPISDSLSAFKKKYHDDLPDYHKGVIVGTITAHWAIIIVDLGFSLFSRYQRRR